MRVTIDTNVLLDYPEALDSYDSIVLLGAVLEEIDNINHSANEEKRYKARVIRNILHEKIDMKHEIECHTTPLYYSLPVGWDYNKPDNQLLQLCKDKDLVLITNDIFLRVKAKVVGVKCKKFKGNSKELYTGIREAWVTEKEYVDLMEGLEKNPYNLFPNEYLIVNNTTTKDQYLLMWNGKYFEEVKVRPITNKYVSKINPLDIYQKAFIHMLQNDNVKVKITDSPYGCGKSYLMIHWALQMLDKEKFSKLYFIKSDTPPKGRKEFPALPGNVNEKCEPLMGVLCDTTSEASLTDILLRNHKLEILPIQFAKGRSLKNSIVFINEAQDFLPSEMERLLSRLGEDSVALIDGSNQQTDNRGCFARSGLNAVSENFKDKNIAAQVNMINDYRSEISKMVNEMDWKDS